MLLGRRLNTFQCAQCGRTIRLSMDVLVNGPKRMVWVSPGEKPEAIKKILQDLGVFNSQGEIRDIIEY